MLLITPFFLVLDPVACCPGTGSPKCLHLDLNLILDNPLQPSTTSTNSLPLGPFETLCFPTVSVLNAGPNPVGIRVTSAPFFRPPVVLTAVVLSGYEAVADCGRMCAMVRHHCAAGCPTSLGGLGSLLRCPG